MPTCAIQLLLTLSGFHSNPDCRSSAGARQAGSGSVQAAAGDAEPYSNRNRHQASQRPRGIDLHRMRSLAEQLRANFEYVIFDSPPIVPFSEARWLTTLSDGAVLVTRCSATTRRAMLWSLEILEELRAPVLGLVLNGVNLEAEYYSYGVKDYTYGSKTAV